MESWTAGSAGCSVILGTIWSILYYCVQSLIVQNAKRTVQLQMLISHLMALHIVTNLTPPIQEDAMLLTPILIYSFRDLNDL